MPLGVQTEAKCKRQLSENAISNSHVTHPDYQFSNGRLHCISAGQTGSRTGCQCSSGRFARLIHCLAA